MNANRPNGKTFALIVLITSGAFILWLCLLLILWWSLKALGSSYDLWAMIEALSTALAAAAVFTAGIHRLPGALRDLQQPGAGSSRPAFRGAQLGRKHRRPALDLPKPGG